MKSDFNIEYTGLDKLYNTLVNGVQSYFERYSLKRAVLGLSGGLDSTIAAVILADALGAKNVFGVSMPSIITPDTSISDAQQLANNLDINFAEISIKNVVASFNNDFERLFECVDSKWGNSSRIKNSFTQDNVQARSRSVLLHAISNEYSSCIPIVTSDKSEIYMGYSTLNGDMSGGFGPIGDVVKTKLFALGYWLNDNRTKKQVIPLSILKKRPSAELAIDPATNKPLCAEDALMPYEFIDELIYLLEFWNIKKDELFNIQMNYERKYGISTEQKEEWINKFFYRMQTQSFKLNFLPPITHVEKNSYLLKCHKNFI